MGFLTSFPPYLSPCSLATFFRKQKQRRKRSTGSLVELERSNSDNNQNQPQNQEAEKTIATVESRHRKRLITVGPNWIMQSYNRHIRNPAIANRAARKRPPSQLATFELVSVHSCPFSNRPIANHRNELCECCPIARSGHRIFADEDFVYVLGGYNQIQSNDKTYTDAWRFNRLTQKWQQCTLADPATPLPNTLASFSLVPAAGGANGHNEVYIFGGTGFPFGQEATNKMHRIKIDASGRIHIKLERSDLGDQLDDAEQHDENGNIQPHAPQYPPRMYGHAMCYRVERDEHGAPLEAVYLAGGTTGHIYNMDIWRLSRRQTPARNLPWKAQLLNMNGFETGRYRLETVIHRQTLYTFGGGAPDFCAEFNELLTFDLAKRKFELVKTRPDPVFGVPRGRKCHALVQDGAHVYIIGGCRDVYGPRGGRAEHQIINDVWRFDLDSLEWCRIRTGLPLPVYFHSASLTPDGCIYVFGGCVDEDPRSQTRVNRMQRLWLRPPSLKHFASAALVEMMPEWQRQRMAMEGVRMSDTQTLISRLFEASVAA